MPPKVQIPPPAGYWDILALLRVLADPEEYTSRLLELEKIRAEVVERAECEESYERQQALEADARAKLADAAKALESARGDAARVRLEAEADSIAVREQLRLAREEWAATRAKDQDALGARAKSLEERERAAAAATEKAKNTLSRGEFLQGEAQKLIAEYNEKVSKLKGIVA
jgi:hypothetical protein